MSRAFVNDESVLEASQTVLPDRAISSHPNLVTKTGLMALDTQLRQAQEAYAAATRLEDANEKFRLAAGPLRDVRYYSERLRTAQVIEHSGQTATVNFGNTVSFKHDDGRISTYRIVGEDEADPAAGLISFASPVAQSLMGKSIGDYTALGEHELEILAISD